MTFDWRARLVWIGRTDSGVVRQRLYDRNIHGLGLSLLDPGAKVWATAISQEGGFPFFYSDPHWHGLAGDGKALQYRQLLDSQLAALGDTGSMLMLDLEQVSMDYVRRLFNGSPGNRGLFNSGNPEKPVGTQRLRPLSYTNEPFKNATVVPLDVFEACLDLHWYYQRYYGDMAEADGDAIALEIMREFRAYTSLNFAERAHAFYDGKLIATDQRDGAYFTAERIPGVFSAVTPLLHDSGLSGTRVLAGIRAVAMTKNALRSHYMELGLAA